MNNRQAREMLALRRELEELRRSVELLRKTPPDAGSSFARAAMLKPVDEIPGRVPSGDDFDVKHGPAKIYDLLIRQGAADWVMKEVKPASGTGKRVELSNPLEEPLTNSSLVLGIQIVGQAWVPVMASGGGGVIEYKILSVATKSSGPFIGLKAATAIIHGAPCGRSDLIGSSVEVIDHSAELFDEPSMVGFTGWASEMVFLSLDSGDPCDTPSPCHWAAINRVCTANTGIYDEPCPPPSP